MMAHLKSIAVILVGLVAIGVRAEADESVRGVCDRLIWRMDKGLSPHAVLESARLILGDEPGEKADALTSAWDKIITDSKCTKSSLNYVATIAECKPERSDSMKTLTEATEAYARKCISPAEIETLLEPLTKGCSLTCLLRNKVAVKFIDDQFIADYDIENPNVGSIGNKARQEKSPRAVANAINRELKKDWARKEPEDVQNYLEKTLFKPCSQYVTAKTPTVKLFAASAYIEGFDKIISSLDQSIGKDFFRYTFCRDIEEYKPSLSGMTLRELQDVGESKDSIKPALSEILAMNKD